MSTGLLSKAGVVAAGLAVIAHAQASPRCVHEYDVAIYLDGQMTLNGKPFTPSDMEAKLKAAAVRSRCAFLYYERATTGVPNEAQNRFDQLEKALVQADLYYSYAGDPKFETIMGPHGGIGRRPANCSDCA